ncbi:MAG: hypothetical protein ACRDWY_00265 [Actinomycetes bacterium]
MTQDPHITAFLERAVSDVVPAERRPTDAVLARAAGRGTARLRRLLAGLLGAAVVGGGAVVVATGSDDGTVVEPPRPLRLTVTPPQDWSAVDAPLEVTCDTQLAPRTVYRAATIGRLESCGEGGGLTVSGPALLVGRVERSTAEQIRAVGSPVSAAGLPGFAVAYDTAAAYVVWVPAGDNGDLGYAVVAPRGPDDVPVFRDLSGAGTWSVSPEALDAAARVTARGDVARRLVLPGEVAAVDLRQEPVNVDPEPGARVLDPEGARAVRAELAVSHAGRCGEPLSSRTLHLQDGRTGRWSRVEVTEDAAGCRTAVSELGGSARITGDPVAVATSRGAQPRAEVTAEAQVVRAHGLTVAVPAGWEVVRAPLVDPCVLRHASIVVADALDPTCFLESRARPTWPYLWLTRRALEDDRFRTDSGMLLGPGSEQVIRGADLDVTWTGEYLVIGHTSALGPATVEAILGRPSTGPGRLLVAGLDSTESEDLRRSVGAG